MCVTQCHLFQSADGTLHPWLDKKENNVKNERTGVGLDEITLLRKDAHQWHQYLNAAVSEDKVDFAWKEP